jgi:two-component system chemotaxis response regulator CheB
VKRIRCLVVEDSATVRRRIVEILDADPELEVVGEAENGRDAILLCRTLRPDVISLDMMLPVMTGLAVTEYVMAHFPIPILIVSASLNRGELFHTYDALAAGAIDVLEKPAGGAEAGDWAVQLVTALKRVSRIKAITHPRLRLGAAGAKPPPPARKCDLAVIGASTGGPAAVVEILRALPPRFPVPLLLVVHIGAQFGKAFADWLDGQSMHPVSAAAGGETLSALCGRVVMAPADRHMIVGDGALHLSDAAERHSCRPSVDVLFESVARERGATAAACLLTGMGRDGAQGLLAIRQAGGLTIAQDEASSVIYGMPREAALLGAAERVLPLAQIGPALAAEFAGKGKPE